MTYTLYCKITFWPKTRICWLPNSRFSERISNVKARIFPFKPAFAQTIEAQSALWQNPFNAVILVEKIGLILDFGKCMALIVTVTCFVLKRIRGRRIVNPYALFEALKVRDFGSNRYNVTVTMMIAIRLFRNPIIVYTFSTVTALLKLSILIKPVCASMALSISAIFKWFSVLKISKHSHFTL